MTTKPTTAPSAICPPEKVIAMVQAIDEAYGLILQLHALLSSTYGEAGGSFRNMADDVQDNFLWCTADLAGRIEATLEASFEVPFKSAVATS